MTAGQNAGYHQAWEAAMTQAKAQLEEEAEAARLAFVRVEAEGAERAVKEAEVAEKAALLVSMGFTESEVQGALEATANSLERAAYWLVEHRQAQQAQQAAFPAEWAENLQDLVEMGFEEADAKEALVATDGELKGAVKHLVAAERQHA